MCPAMVETFHLTPRDVWDIQSSSENYVPEPFEIEGFIHCTNGKENVIVVGNRYYREDDRDFVCLVIDVTRVSARIRYEDDCRIYPHIYGPLNIDAVAEVVAVLRAEDGTFLSLCD